MSVLYPRLPDRAADAVFREVRERAPQELAPASTTSHLAQYFAATGGVRVTPEELRRIRVLVCDLATEHGFPDEIVGRKVNRFDNAIAATLHSSMGLVAAEAADRRLWAFLALVVLPDVAVWRYPQPPGDRLLATDITRHVFGRLWWRAELLHDASWLTDPYHLLDVFSERNFDQILARRRSIGGSPELVRALANEWPKFWIGPNETDVLRDTLKHLMRRGAFQDLLTLPEPILRREVAAMIALATTARAGV